MVELAVFGEFGQGLYGIQLGFGLLTAGLNGGLGFHSCGLGCRRRARTRTGHPLPAACP